MPSTHNHNMKKLILIIIIIAGVSQIGYFGYQIYVNFLIPRGTGAIYTPPSQSDLILGNEFNNLQKSLPLSTQYFSIVEFNNSKGAFIVNATDNSVDLPTEFNNWYATSSFSAIPKTMFLLQQ